MRDVHLAICLPTNGTVDAGTAGDLAALMMTLGLATAGQQIRGVSFHQLHLIYLPLARERLARQALGAGATHLLWLDSDMRFPADAAHRLLAHDVPMVGVNYARRDDAARPTARAMDGTLMAPRPDGLEAASVIGFGCCLLARGRAARVERAVVRGGVCGRGVVRGGLAVLQADCARRDADDRPRALGRHPARRQGGAAARDFSGDGGRMTNVETVTIAIVGADDSIAIMSFVTKEFAADGSVNWSRMADAPAIDAEIRSMTTPNEQGVCSLGNERVPIKAWYPIDPKDVPTDRTYREALRHDGTRFSYDLPAAKAQALIAIRAARGEQMTVSGRPVDAGHGEGRRGGGGRDRSAAPSPARPAGDLPCGDDGRDDDRAASSTPRAP